MMHFPLERVRPSVDAALGTAPSDPAVADLPSHEILEIERAELA